MCHRRSLNLLVRRALSYRGSGEREEGIGGWGHRCLLAGTQLLPPSTEKDFLLPQAYSSVSRFMSSGVNPSLALDERRWTTSTTSTVSVAAPSLGSCRVSRERERQRQSMQHKWHW